MQLTTGHSLKTINKHLLNLGYRIETKDILAQKINHAFGKFKAIKYFCLYKEIREAYFQEQIGDWILYFSFHKKKDLINYINNLKT